MGQREDGYQDFGNGNGDEITYEDVIDYLFNNNRGGSYDVSE
jgi:hypothetical protein